jgi:hypothetical protein
MSSTAQLGERTAHAPQGAFGERGADGGAWLDWAALGADAASAALASALANGAPFEACVEELLPVSSSLVLARRVYASPQHYTHTPGSAAAALRNVPSCSRSGDDLPFAVLLTHSFALSGVAASEGCDATQLQQRLQLTTLFLPQRAAPELMAAIFGAGAHVTLSSPEERTFTDVALGDVRSVAPESLAAWAPPARAALRATLRAQRLAAVASCIEARWFGGFFALQAGAGALRPPLAPTLSALTSRLHSARFGGAPTRQTLLAREYEAETLEAAGRYMEAAALYKQNITDDARNPEARLLQTPPMQWEFYGLALKRAGRYTEACRAYDAGLRALQRCLIEPDTPQWRETMRLHLLEKCITLSDASGDRAHMESAFQRIFAAQTALLQAQGEQEWSYAGVHGNCNACIIGRISGRRFQVFERRAAADDAVHAGLTLWGIEEVPRTAGTPTQLPVWRPAPRSTLAEADLKRARMSLAMRRDAVVPPSLLPPMHCAVCGEPATKCCAACGGPAYCSAACQKSQWKTHKPACMAARAAAAGGAAGNAATE